MNFKNLLTQKTKKEPKLKQEQDTDDTSATKEQVSAANDKAYKGFDPVIGRNLLSVLITDIINIVYAPGWVSLVSFFVDISNFMITPMLGGIVNASVYVNYQHDPLTYQHAGLDKDYLYGSSMLFAKDYLYSSMGRPDFYDTGEPYKSPDEADEKADFPTE